VILSSLVSPAPPAVGAVTLSIIVTYNNERLIIKYPYRH
jgi:hypothetical protein